MPIVGDNRSLRIAPTPCRKSVWERWGELPVSNYSRSVALEELLGIGTRRGQSCELCDDVGAVFGVGDTEPRVRRVKDFYRRGAFCDEVVDCEGDVVLELRISLLLIEEVAEELL